MTPEGKVKAMVKRRLKKLQKLWRFMPVQNGMGAQGLDFFLCHRGWFISIETKAPGHELTARQETTALSIIQAGGMVFVVEDEKSMDACEEVLSCL